MRLVLSIVVTRTVLTVRKLRSLADPSHECVTVSRVNARRPEAERGGTLGSTLGRRIMKTYQTKLAPIPLGHYNQAVSDGVTLCISTQLPIQPDQAPDNSMSIEDQTTQVLRNILAILESASLTADSLLRVTLYVTDGSSWSAVNQAFEKVLGDAKPARGILQVAGINHGFSVAGDAIASHRVT
jgi:2-iminobutanoate/2-iminopropanoate deaminase